jgi:hypothetical protein
MIIEDDFIRLKRVLWDYKNIKEQKGKLEKLK